MPIYFQCFGTIFGSSNLDTILYNLDDLNKCGKCIIRLCACVCVCMCVALHLFCYTCFVATVIIAVHSFLLSVLHGRKLQI